MKKQPLSSFLAFAMLKKQSNQFQPGRFGKTCETGTILNRCILVTCVMLAIGLKSAQAQTITTYAGNGATGTSLGSGSAISAEMNNPAGVGVDGSGNLYIADTRNNRILKVNSTGTISLLAGTGSTGYSGDNGMATDAQINNPVGITTDGHGNVYFADENNEVVRKISSSGIITTVAGNNASGYSGDGGPATNASLYNPIALAFDNSGNLFIADNYNNVIRRVDASTHNISTFAGNGYGAGAASAGGADGVDGTGYFSGDGGAATAATLNYPFGVAVDGSGNVYIADADNNRIRKVNTSGIISTVAGSGTSGYTGNGGSATAAELSFCTRVAVDGYGNLYINDYFNNCIRKVNTSGIISLYAGNTIDGFTGDGGAAYAAELNAPEDIVADATGNLFIADYANNRVRFVYNNSPVYGPSTVYAGSVITLTDSSTGGTWSLTPAGVATITSGGDLTGVTAGSVIVSYTTVTPYGTFASTKTVSVTNPPTSPIINTIAGTPGTHGYSGDNGAATSATLYNPNDVVVDGSGNAYIADRNNHVIRKVTPAGIITTFAGGGAGSDGGPATAARLYDPVALAIDHTGNIYIADDGDYRIRKINTSGIISTIAGTGTSGDSGDGAAATNATLTAPSGVAVDASNNVYIADRSTNKVRVVSASGTINIFAGTGTASFGGDNADAGSAQLNSPQKIACDNAGNVYIADYMNNRIRKVNTSHTITTFAGNGASSFGGDGGQATNAQLNLPSSVTTDADGNVYIGDEHNNRIRKVNTSGVISSYAGTGSAGFSGDGGYANLAALSQPNGVATDIYGNLYIADYSNQVVRKVGGSVSTRSLSFIFGYVQNISVCANWVTSSMNPFLAVKNTTSGRMLTWSMVTPPTHGTAHVACTAPGTGGIVQPTGTYYTPSASSGTDQFTLSVTDGISTIIATVNITINALPATPTITGSTHNICIGSATTLSGLPAGGYWTSNGSAAVTFTSAGVVTGLSGSAAPIIYYRTVDAHNCYSDAAYPITVSVPGLIGGIYGSATSLCSGSSITLTHGSAGGTWSITNAALATVAASGSNTALLTGMGSGRDTVLYTVTNACGTLTARWPFMTVSTATAPITGPTSVATGSAINLNDANTDGVWSTSDASVATVSSTGRVTGVRSGTASISYTRSNMCGTGRATYAVTIGAGRGMENETNTSNSSLRVYPNPTTDLLFLVLPETTSPSTLLLTDLNGKVVFSATTELSSIQLDLQSFPSGMYFLQVYCNGVAYCNKVIKQ